MLSLCTSTFVSTVSASTGGGGGLTLRESAVTMFRTASKNRCRQNVPVGNGYAYLNCCLWNNFSFLSSVPPLLPSCPGGDPWFACLFVAITRLGNIELQIIKMKSLFHVLSSPRKSSSEPDSDILIFQTLFLISGLQLQSGEGWQA